MYTVIKKVNSIFIYKEHDVLTTSSRLQTILYIESQDATYMSDNFSCSNVEKNLNKWYGLNEGVSYRVVVPNKEDLVYNLIKDPSGDQSGINFKLILTETMLNTWKDYWKDV